MDFAWDRLESHSESVRGYSPAGRDGHAGMHR